MTVCKILAESSDIAISSAKKSFLRAAPANWGCFIALELEYIATVSSKSRLELNKILTLLSLQLGHPVRDLLIPPRIFESVIHPGRRSDSLGHASTCIIYGRAGRAPRREEFRFLGRTLREYSVVTHPNADRKPSNFGARSSMQGNVQLASGSALPGSTYTV